MHRLLLRSLRSSALGALVFAGALLKPMKAQASDPFLVIPEPGTAETTAAYRYANMTNDEAIAELNRRGLPYVTVDPVPGVRAPVRLTGRLHGVLIHTALAPNQRATSPFEILDARLALALDDFTAILEKHDIDEIEHFSMYRPNVAREIPAPKQQSAKAPPKQSKDDSQVAPAKPSESVAGPVADKPTTKKVATRSKPVAPHKPAKKPKKESVAGNPKPPAPTPKTEKPLPHAEKPQPKSAPKHLGKAGLGPKTTATSVEKGKKQKGPGETEETVSPDKQVEVVAEPLPKKDDAPTMQPNPAWAAPGTRHPGGLAIDVGKLRKKDGTWISVLTHFHGKIGDKACGADAPVPESAEARELRALVCEAMAGHVFTYVLTPNYNAAHENHFHMEIKPGVKWFLVH